MQYSEKSNKKVILDLHRQAIDRRLFFTKVPWYPLRQMQATLATIIDLDEKHGLESIASTLHHSVELVKMKLTDRGLNPEFISALSFHLTILHDMEEEFAWLASYGCRLHQ